MTSISLMRQLTPILKNCDQALSYGRGKFKNLTCCQAMQLYRFCDDLDTNLYKDESSTQEWDKMYKSWENLDINIEKLIPIKIRDFIGNKEWDKLEG